MLLCPICKSPMRERGKSKRPGELLLVCKNGHERQGRISHGYTTLYTTGKGGRRKTQNNVRMLPEVKAMLKDEGWSVQRYLDHCLERDGYVVK